MTRTLAMTLGLSLLGTMLPVLGEEAARQPPQVSTTDHVSFAPGGMIRINGSYGDLNVEGWDQSEVEVTVIKSMPYGYKPKRQDDATRHLNGVQIVTERKSPTELTISTTLASRHGDWAPPLPSTTTGGVRAQYEIHVPRDSKLAIHHGTGFVFVRGVTGEIEASAGRGDILLMLPDSGMYAIDAKTNFGAVSSDLDGSVISRYVIGQKFTGTLSPPARRLYLRMGFGGITIKSVPPEADPPVPAYAK